MKVEVGDRVIVLSDVFSASVAVITHIDKSNVQVDFNWLCRVQFIEHGTVEYGTWGRFYTNQMMPINDIERLGAM